MKVERKSLAMENGATYKKKSKLSVLSPCDFQGELPWAFGPAWQMKVERKSLAIEIGATCKKKSKLGLFSPRDFQESSHGPVNAVAADQFGDAFVAGTTCSSNFPVTANAFQARAPGGGKGVEGCDAFVAKLDPTGSRYLYATYLGGSGADTATSLWVDPNGNAWVAGFTSSPDFPVTHDAMAPHLKGEVDGFLAELDAEGKHLLYGTYVGGSGNNSVQAMAGGRDGILYLTGASNSAAFLRSGKIEDSEGFVLSRLGR